MFRRPTVSPAARRRIRAMHRCARSAKARRNMQRTLYGARQFRKARARAAAIAAHVRATMPLALHAIARCESGGNPGAISAGGRYRGKYQFAISTWQSVGGVGDPAAAPEAVQDRLAAILYRREGATPWPVCGQ